MHAAEFAAAFAAAVKYAANEHGHETAAVGFPIRLASGDTLNADTPRHIAADRLEDDGRSTEAAKLRTPGLIAPDTRPGHVGKVRRGVYGDEPIHRAAWKVEQHLDDWSNQGHRHPHIQVNDEDFDPEEVLGGPLDPDHVLVSHVEGDYDGDVRPGAEHEHNEVHYDDLADHFADIIDIEVSSQQRNNWGDDEGRYSVYHEPSDANDRLAEIMGWDTSRDAVRRLGYRSPLNAGLRFYANHGEGYSGDAEEAERFYRNLADDLESDLADRHAGKRGDDLNHPSLNHADLTEAAKLARELEKEYDELSKEPDRREEMNEERYQQLLQQLRDTKPIVPDPADNDD